MSVCGCGHEPCPKCKRRHAGCLGHGPPCQCPAEPGQFTPTEAIMWELLTGKKPSDKEVKPS